MEKELFLKPSPDADGQKITFEAGEGVADKVLLRFLDTIQTEEAGSVLGMHVGQRESFKSTYDKGWYELYRENPYRIVIRKR